MARGPGVRSLVFRRPGADLNDALDKAWMGRCRWAMTSARAREEHWHIMRISFPKAFEPFFDEADRTANAVGELGVCPLGMLVDQAAKCSSALQSIVIKVSLHRKR
jgi:hypothetical protein